MSSGSAHQIQPHPGERYFSNPLQNLYNLTPEPQKIFTCIVYLVSRAGADIPRQQQWITEDLAGRCLKK